MPSWHDDPLTDTEVRALGRGSLRVAAVLAVVVVLLVAVMVAAGGARSESASRAESIRAIKLVFGPRAPAAIRVALCESRLYHRAISPTGDYGLFQANYAAHHWRGESTRAFAVRHFNIAYHVRWAYRLSRGGTNWRPWTCRWAA